MANQTLSERIQKELFAIRGFDVVLLPRAFDRTLVLVTRLGTLETIKQAAIRVGRRTPSSVTVQEIFDEYTPAHMDLHRH